MTLSQKQGTSVLDQRRDVPPQAGAPVYPWPYYAAPPTNPPAATVPAPALPGGVRKLAYTVDEAAQALGVSRASVYNLIHAGGFPSMKLRGRRLISAELLAEWVRQQAGCIPVSTETR